MPPTDRLPEENRLLPHTLSPRVDSVIYCHYCAQEVTMEENNTASGLHYSPSAAAVVQVWQHIAASGDGREKHNIVCHIFFDILYVLY